MNYQRKDLIVCELKAVGIVNPVWEAQILSHLKLTGKHVGFLINFNLVKIKNRIRRYCLE
ncbi:GxxExxY protein [Niabella aurantiaca]|uniref:GxxExxY protein n=1 Tax=Niabella aurantiaca TaxID=379900 RepID=UPI00037C6621|nr:GxxExxY protein [Niabella aurantiaca]